MLKILQKLIKIRLLTPVGLFHFAVSALTEGVNLMLLLRFSAKLHRDKIAFVDENAEISYNDLFLESQQLARNLQATFQLQPKQKVALICRNNISLIRSIFAVSRLGLDIFLLNPEMTLEQIDSLNSRHKFDFFIYDAEVSDSIKELDLENKSLVTYSDSTLSVEQFAKQVNKQTLKRAFSTNIVVLTGGTTGTPKTAKRKASVSKFLNPFFALLVKLNLDKYKSVYIATPIYHGFGVSAIFIGLVLGEKMFMLNRFEAKKGCELIQANKIEVVTLVPLMLQRMLSFDADSLKSLDCIISGGAALNPALIEETFAKLGDKLFNLYGTSEAGFSVMATPQDLRFSSNTIGKEIKGVKLFVLDSQDKKVEVGKVGRLCISSSWAVKNQQNKATETGDLAYLDENGYIYLCGRNDEMIVSGGENVYPIELENVLIKHAEVNQVAVIGIEDKDFGQRLKAFVVRAEESNLDETQLLEWLQSRVARFQMPKKIEFIEDLPITSVGKINKKALS
jgi:acyl-CoA synthetase (AMP-forming)/AMP-acid ligase II